MISSIVLQPYLGFSPYLVLRFDGCGTMVVLVVLDVDGEATGLSSIIISDPGAGVAIEQI